MAELEKMVFVCVCVLILAFPILLDQQPTGDSNGKESTCNAGDSDSVLVSGRSPGEENGYSLQYACLENPMSRGACWATVYEVAKSQT